MSEYETRAPTERPIDHVELGPGLGAEVDRRLIGDVRGKRVLELGCGAGHGSVGLARRGARVIATDAEPHQVAAARTLAAAHDVVVEFHDAHPAEIAFVRADQIDLALSVWSLSLVDDLDRVLRQLHRVLRSPGHVVIALPHPASMCADPADPARNVVPWQAGTAVGDRFVHTAEEVITSLSRANFVVDTLLERRHHSAMPASLVVRARKPSG